MTAAAGEPFAGFWKQWGDGQAELAAYDLTVPRYGAPRAGTAVTIFVTEPFSRSAGVKADPGRHPATDVTPVIKLNLVRDFQTGIYDYNEMLSAFVEVDTGSPLKLSFSRQEWCGHLYQQIRFGASKVEAVSHSYFDGAADQSLSWEPTPVLAEDALLVWARGVAEPRLAVGEARPVTLLAALGTPGVFSRTAAMAERRKDGDREVWRVTVAGSYSKTIFVEPGGERRILGWESSNGERATLVRSARVKYWELNGVGGEAALQKLGLTPRPRRTM